MHVGAYDPKIIGMRIGSIEIILLGFHSDLRLLSSTFNDKST